MTRNVPWIALLGLITAACATDGPSEFGQIDAARLARADDEPGQWFTGGRDFVQTYHSPLTDINDRNVTDLGFAWQYELPTTRGLEATPVVVDGVMYTSGPWGTVFALDAATGEELWTFDPEVDPQTARFACCDIVNRGVAVWEGTVFVAALDGRLIALDARTGETLWEVDTIVDHGRAYTVTGAPYIAKDVVVIGNSGGEYDARGYVSAYETGDGALRWRFFIVPGDPSLPFEHPELEWAAETWDPNSLWEVGLGGTAWDGMAYDPQLNLLYVGTGNSTPYARKLRSPSGGDNLFLASILAINPDDGRLVWHYQTTPAENWDFTAVQKMILADLEIDGRTRRVLMQAPKNGFFYVLDRESGELLSAEPYVPVNWATHVDRETGRPVETGQGEYFYEPKLVFPSAAGGHNWQPMAFNPNTGLVYIPAIEIGNVFRVPPAPFEYEPRWINQYSEFFMTVPGAWGWDAYRAAGLPPFEGLAEGQPDPTARGILRAWDPVQQKTVWEVDVSGQWTGELHATWNGGGVTTTSGNLVFQGQSTGELYVYSADTGEQLHVIDVGASIMAAPTTYVVNGEQYVAVMAGLGGAVGQTPPPGTAAAKYGNEGQIIALKLGGGEVPKRPVLPPIGPMPRPPVARQGTPGQIEEGAAVFGRYCVVCHTDLSRLSAETHATFSEIVLGGIRADLGMASFEDVLTAAQVEAIRVYLIDVAWQAFESERQ
ncbi:MAG: PQQ-dependent dehydrogenase, methanol/ethanol family [Gemmatimonadales bacterium]